MIGGIVLAGGHSERMGRPKALLRAGPETFLDRAVHTLQAGGCDAVVVVLDRRDPDVAALRERLEAHSAWAEAGGDEQIDSLRLGIRALPRPCEAVVVLPVDHPLVKPGTVRSLIETYRANQAPVVRAVHQGRHGHPVLFGAAMFDELLQRDLPDGARGVVRGHARDRVDVEVEDAGVLVDVDTPEDYERHFGA